MSDNTGGPAFPHPQGWRRDPEVSDGMTLRDYFAAKAMQALLNRAGRCGDLGHMEAINVAADSFHMADAMLAARETKNG